MLEHRTISLADQVFEQLETDILTGKYQRGEILTEGKLSAELGVSRTPVREAMRRLEQEHLIGEGGKGVVVIGVNEKDIDDIFLLRKKLECIAAEYAANNLTDEQIAELKEIVELQEFYVEKKAADQIKYMDNRFHEFIYRHSGSVILYDILVPLHKKVQKYRRSSVERNSRAVASVAEHKAIFEAIAAHDAKSASELTVIHIENAHKNIRLKGN